MSDIDIERLVSGGSPALPLREPAGSDRAVTEPMKRSAVGRSGIDAEFETIRRRATPGLYILGEDLRIVLASPSDDRNLLAQHLGSPGRSALHLPHSIETAVRRLIARSEAGDDDANLIALVHPMMVVRVARLDGAAGQHIAVFVERFKARDALRGARERFGFSPRELEVVDQLVQGSSTAEIAEKLIIAETTVQDHVKHIARKTKARNRAEIVARVLGAN